MFLNSNFCFNNLDPLLKHLNFDQVVQLINRYYEGEKNSLLVSEYHLDIPISKLVSIFPLIKTNIECEHCHIAMVTKLKSKTSYEKLSRQDVHCKECGHLWNRKCSCKSCIEKEILEKSLQDQKEKLINEEKRDFLEELQHKVKIDENSLDLDSRLYLAIVLRECLSEDGSSIEDLYLKVKNITPYEEYTDQVLNHLIENDLIVPSLDNDLKNFVKTNYMEYYIYHVKYRLNITPLDGNFSKMIHRLMYPKSEFFIQNKAYCYDLWKKISFYECMQYLMFKMQSVKYDFNPGLKTKTVFENLVCHFSVGQIYSIIYRAIANSTEQYQSGKITKIHAQNMVIASCEAQGERALANNWELTNYSRIKELPQSQISKLLFDSILGISYLGFNEKPTMSL